MTASSLAWAAPWLDREHLINTRDLATVRIGAGHMRPGRLIRGPVPRACLEPGWARYLTVRTIVDLRSDAEREGDDETCDADDPVRVIHAPVTADRHFDVGDHPGPADYYRAYLGLLPGAARSAASVISLLARAQSLPLLVGCGIGKDRTGVTIALVLSALGASGGEIAHEFELTARDLRRRNTDALWVLAGGTARAYARRVEVRAATMAELLRHVDDEHGGAAALVGTAGGTPAELAQAGANLCDDRLRVPPQPAGRWLDVFSTSWHQPARPERC